MLGDGSLDLIREYYLNSPIVIESKGRLLMDVKWQTPKCILCLSTGGITKEHVLPVCLRGKLVAKFLCKNCNSRLGQGMESKVKKDPQIRLGIERLAEARPGLAKSLRKGLNYIGHSQQGPVVDGYMHDGAFIPWEQTLDDGSLILPPNRSLGAIKKKAERSGIEPFPGTAEALERLSSGDSVRAARGAWITKWIVDSIKPDLSGPQIDPVVPTKIAFEFLALRCGNDIYESPTQLKVIRSQILSGELLEEDIHVQRAVVGREQLIHGIVFEGNNPGAQVQVRLFGKLAFRVQFRRFSVSCPRFGYTHDLISDKECVNQVP